MSRMVGGEFLYRAGGGISGVERDWVWRVAHADIVVDNVVHQTATRSVRLDADSIVGAIQREIGDANLADAAIGFAADGHSVTPIEMVLTDRHIGDATGAALDRHVVVTGANVTVRDRDVLRPRSWIDPVSVAGAALWCVDLQSPYGKTIAVVVDDVEVRRVLQCDPVDGEVVRSIGDDQAWNLLAASCASLLCEVPPGDIFAKKFFTTPAVDNTVAHNARAGYVLGGDQRLASIGRVVDQPATAGRLFVDSWIARREESNAFVDDEGYTFAQLERPAEECGFGCVGAQDDSVALAACVERLLNSCCVQRGLVSLGESVTANAEVCVERGADRRKHRLRHRPRILCGEEWSG